MTFSQDENGLPVTDPALEPTGLGKIRLGQFILDKAFLAEMDRVKNRMVPTAEDSDRVRAAIEVNAEIKTNKTKCEDLKDGRKLCIDTSARPSFPFHRVAATKLDNWRVVGMRVDLCAGANNDTNEQCEIEFRLTAQAFGDCLGPPAEGTCPLNEATNMFDISAHLLYRLGFLDVKNGTISGAPDGVTFTLQEIIRDLQRIKEAGGSTNGRPLGVHPGLKSEMENSGSAVGDEVTRVINKYTRGGAGMTFAASVQLTEHSDVWVFFHGGVENGHWTPAAITGSESTWSIRTASVQGKPPRVPTGRGRMYPPTEIHSDRVSINPLFNYNFGEILPHEPNEHRKLAVNDLPSFFDNPGRYGDVNLKVGNLVAPSVRNTDCVSCHSTVVRSFEWGIKSFDPTKGAKAALTPSMYRPPVGTTAYLDPAVIPRSNYSLRNFGYFVSFRGAPTEVPTVMTRAVDESAELVNLINTRFIGKPNPGLRCTPGGNEDEDPEAALAASIGEAGFSDASQKVIRRTQNVHAMIFDCLLFESYKPGVTFETCADRCQKPN